MNSISDRTQCTIAWLPVIILLCFVHVIFIEINVDKIINAFFCKRCKRLSHLWYFLYSWNLPATSVCSETLVHSVCGPSVSVSACLCMTWCDGWSDRLTVRHLSRGSQHLGIGTPLTRAAPGQTERRRTTLGLGDVRVHRTFAVIVHHRHPARTAARVYRQSRIQQHIDTQSVWCGQYHLLLFCCFRRASP